MNKIRQDTGSHDSQTVLLIDEDREERQRISSMLRKLDLHTFETARGSEAIEILATNPVDLVITDVLLPDTEGITILHHVRKNRLDADVVILTESDATESARRILRQGADDYVERPVKEADLLHKIRTILDNRQLKKCCGIIGRSEALRQNLETVRLIAPTNVSVLITGESGTGKELVARAIHRNSLRKDEPFIAVNCGALPEGVLESELFGHEKGAFTSADKQRAGRFEIASKGTLLLDEIGEMPLSAQVKLLRVLETKEFMRVGGTRILHSDARIIASTNKTLEDEVARGTFRRDLFYRLKIVTIDVPPLRVRREDIPLLVSHFAPQIYREHNLPEHEVPDDVIKALQEYDWPGNVRELRNVLESMIILSPKRALRLENLPPQISGRTEYRKNLPVPVEKSRDAVEREIIYKTLLGVRADIAELKDLMIHGFSRQPDMQIDTSDWVETVRDSEEQAIHRQPEEDSESAGEHESIADMERKLIISTLNSHNGNRKKTADALGIGERTLYRKLKEYGIS
jgi:DNA-binding NtrC family response regulator